MISEQCQKISRGLVVLVFCSALLSSGLLMNGDQFGKVNLLYLLFLFVIFPLLSLAATLILPLFNTNKSFVSVLLALPVWPRSWLADIQDLKRRGILSDWLFAQGQKLALTFSLGSLLAFVLVLLFNDVTFVWRSTLLSAEQLFPVLAVLAKPWFFIPQAQPLLEMVALAQDSRLGSSAMLGVANSWWQYVLVSQICYALLPRCALFYFGRRRLNLKLQQLNRQYLEQEKTQIVTPDVSQVPLKAVAKLEKQREAYVLVSSVELSDELQAQWDQQLGVAEQVYPIAGLGSLQSEQAALADPRSKILLVAAWEPPMGDLEDFMRQTQGIIIPVDWQKNKFCKLSVLHLDEWRRFCYSLENWQLQQVEVVE